MCIRDSPLVQTLGAWTAAEQGAIFFENIVNENTTSTRQLIIHEVMGRNCGYLTAQTALEYKNRVKNKLFFPELLIDDKRWGIDAIYIPEIDFDFQVEAERLKKVMDEKDCVNIFLSEGAGLEAITREMESNGEEIPRDAFGHVKLDEINPGQWFAKRFSKALNAEKTLVQKSGYFARSAKSNDRDLQLIKNSAQLAAKCALDHESGLVGLDMDENGELLLIDFNRIKGEKPFDHKEKWFVDTLRSIGQID